MGAFTYLDTMRVTAVSSSSPSLWMLRVSIKVWLSLVAVALYSALCFAQAPPALKSLIGEVTSIDAAGKQIKLKSDDGAAYTVTLSDNTSFLRIPPGETHLKKASKIV